MADEPFALSTVPPAPPAQGDYDAICATVMESARGRWFLQEFARRNRNADTRVVLDAIERIEAVIRSDRDREAYRSFRGDLLDMAKVIAQTRAEVAELPMAPGPSAAPAAAAREVFATTERIHDVAWTLRERGLDPSTCDQIEALAVSILSASSLRDPSSGRAHQLGEVLQYLERRINAMLDSCAAHTPAAGEADEATGDVHPAPAGNGHDALAPDAAAPPPEPQAVAPALPGLAEPKHEAEAAPMPFEPVVEPPSAPHPMLGGLEAGSVALVEPEPDLLPFAAAGAETAAAAETPPAMGDASAEQATELSSAHAQVEAVELELAPLTVAAAGPAAVDLAAPAAELEHAPIIVEAAFEPPDTDAPAAEAEAASAPDLPGFDLMPEPTGTASAQPDPDPVAAAEQPPGELVALEVEPLIASPRSPPVRDDAPPVEIELDPIAVHLAHPEPTPEATERAEGHSLEPTMPATAVLEGEAAQPPPPFREPPVA